MTDFFVPGVPAPQGSKRYVGNGVMVESSKRVKPWRSDVREGALAASASIDGEPQPIDGPVWIALEFRMPRPRSHYRSGKYADRLRDNAPWRHARRPDVDKLTRAVLDAVKDIIWRDDSQVCHLTAWKCYSDNPGVWVQFGQLEAVA